MRFLIQIMMVSMALILGAALMPTIIDMMTDNLRGPDNFNCAAAPEYNSSAETNDLGCTVAAIGPSFLLLGIIFGGIAMILYGRAGEPQSI